MLVVREALINRDGEVLDFGLGYRIAEFSSGDMLDVCFAMTFPAQLGSNHTIANQHDEQHQANVQGVWRLCH